MNLTRRDMLLYSTSLAALSAAPSAWADTSAAPTAPTAASIQDYGIGDPNAKVQIVEYLSFTCPHCEHFHAEVYPLLKSEFIDKGLVRLIYHEVYFDRYGLWGAMLARCGGPTRYIGIVDMLYNKQIEWAGNSDPTVAVDQLKKIGLIAGISNAEADKCLQDQAMAKALVAHYQANLAKDYDKAHPFHGTPSFIINGVRYDNMAWSDMKKIIDDDLAKA